MPRKSSITTMPLHMQLALDQRLRATAYTGLDEHLAWLKEKGHECSRSALGRHLLALRKGDSSRGDARARVADMKRVGMTSKANLLMELGRLQLAQARILAQLQAMEDSGMEVDEPSLASGT